MIGFGRKKQKSQDVDLVVNPDAGNGEVWVTNEPLEDGRPGVWLQTDHWTDPERTTANPLTPTEARRIANALNSAADIAEGRTP